MALSSHLRHNLHCNLPFINFNNNKLTSALFGTSTKSISSFFTLLVLSYTHSLSIVPIATQIFTATSTSNKLF